MHTRTDEHNRARKTRTNEGKNAEIAVKMAIAAGLTTRATRRASTLAGTHARAISRYSLFPLTHSYLFEHCLLAIGVIVFSSHHTNY